MTSPKLCTVTWWWWGMLGMTLSLERYKRACAHGGGVLSFWFWEITGPNTQLHGTSVHSYTGFARNTQPRGTMCLVYCSFTIVHHYWSSFGSYDICLLGHPLRGCRVPDSKDHCALSVLICDQWSECILSFVELWHFVASLGGPEEGPDK